MRRKERGSEQRKEIRSQFTLWLFTVMSILVQLFPMYGRVLLRGAKIWPQTGNRIRIYISLWRVVTVD